MSEVDGKIVNEKYIGKEVNPINQSDIFHLADIYSKKFSFRSNNFGFYSPIHFS